jgi:putative ABC transport system permease protein
MFTYYVSLALRSLRRNVVLTALMIVAVGVGIGASMTTLTVFRAMSADPIRDKSRQLYAVQVDNWGPSHKGIGTGDKDGLQQQLSYQDAVNLMAAHAAPRQAAMYRGGAALTPDNPQLRPFQVNLRVTYADFFAMFQVPFIYGSPWSGADDQNHAAVVVISRELNDKVFGGGNSVGKVLNFDGRKYRVVGVTEHWDPLPLFYDLNNGAFGKGEEAFLPFTRAIEDEMTSWGNFNCSGDIGAPGWAGRLRSECIWIQFWAEMPSAADAQRYQSQLSNYAAEQQRVGRFSWAPHVHIRNVREWLVYQRAVSDESRILVLVSFSFLLVCLINAMGLMLAKVMGRAADIGVRRALGANRNAIFGQCLIEAAVIGLAGGVLGLLLTALGLLGLRSVLSDAVGRLTHFSAIDMALAIGLAVIATTLAGLYPTWRAAHVQPAWQLKVQ